MFKIYTMKTIKHQYNERLRFNIVQLFLLYLIYKFNVISIKCQMNYFPKLQTHILKAINVKQITMNGMEGEKGKLMKWNLNY